MTTYTRPVLLLLCGLLLLTLAIAVLNTLVPLWLAHDRLNKIEIAEVGADHKPIAGTEKTFDVDTLLLSVGLIPENHLGDNAGIVMDPHTRGPVVDEDYMTSIEGVFAAGNGLNVHDLADFAAHQGGKAGEGAARYIQNGKRKETTIHTVAGENVGYVVPGILHTANLPAVIEFYFRVRKPLKASTIVIRSGEKVIRTMHSSNLP